MQILSGKRNRALKAVLYGPEGIGKSTFASHFPEPLYIDTEGSTAFMDVRRFPRPQSWAELTEQVKHVRDTPGLCKTLAIDTADWAEQLCMASICANRKLSGIEDLGYGKGYVYLAEEFGKLLNLLEEVIDREINVILTAHAMMRKFEQPDEMGAYDRWELKLQKKTAPLVKEWSDLLLFANYKTMSVSADDKGKKFKAQGGRRVMYTTHHPCWDAKNRHSLPEEMPFDFRAIEPYLFPQRTIPVVPPTEPVTAQESVQFPEPQPEPPMNVDLSPASNLDAVPPKLSTLMDSAHVSETEVREIIADKGYFTMDTPWSVMEEAGFIDGWLLPWWEKIVQMITEKPNRLPF